MYPLEEAEAQSNPVCEVCGNTGDYHAIPLSSRDDEVILCPKHLCPTEGEGYEPPEYPDPPAADLYMGPREEHFEILRRMESRCQVGTVEVHDPEADQIDEDSPTTTEGSPCGTTRPSTIRRGTAPGDEQEPLPAHRQAQTPLPGLPDP